MRKSPKYEAEFELLPSMRTMRTLIISPNWIGDAVMAQPLLRSLKEAHPERAIDVLAPPFLAAVWRAMPQVDTVIEASFQRGALQLKARWLMARQLRQRGYDAAYVLPNTVKFALIPWLAGIRKRVGYLGEQRYGMLNVIHYDDKQKPRGMVAFYAALAEPPSRIAPVDVLRPELRVTATESEQVMQELGLSPQRRLVVFAPGAEFGSAKRWPAAYFGSLAQRVRAAAGQHEPAQIVLLGSAKDRPVAAEITGWTPAVIDLTGATTLAQAIALIARADAVVSNDSGLLHIASGLNRPVLALYGPTDPAHAPPFSDVATSLYLGLSCAPCRQRECPLQHHKCMRDMLPEQVWHALQPMLPKPLAASNDIAETGPY
jgi:heptosyltransferase-2